MYKRMDRNLPHSIWWERYYIQFLQALIVDQHDPQYNFLPMVHLATPLHLWHTFRGEVVSSIRPTGTTS